MVAGHQQAGNLIKASPEGSVKLVTQNETTVELDTEAQAKPLVGENIGPYEVMREIGRGGMGEIYLVHDVRLDRCVALKLLSARFTKDMDGVRRFKQEARAASALNHPNIIAVYDLGEIDGKHFMATEFIEGKTLRQHISSGRIAVPRILDIAIQVSAALSAAHEAGIAHRDIKPENIMVRPDGIVKVLDFGIAKLIQPPLNADIEGSINSKLNTVPGIILGTVKYMSPEQVRGQAIDIRTDIFSLGVVIYEMIAGHAPFEGETASDIIASILEKEPLPLKWRSPGIPPALQHIVSKALCKDRDRRYQSAEGLLADLKNLRLELEIEAKLNRAGRADLESDARPEDQCPKGELSPLFRPIYSAGLQETLEPVGGAVPLGSKFYIVRPADEEFRSAIVRADSIVLVKGAHQVGKTSLLARGLQRAREAGASVVLTDFQSLEATCLESTENLLLTLAESVADQLDLDIYPDQMWSPHFSPTINFERYLRREVLARTPSPIVWGLDEVDRLFTCDFGSEIFGLFRSWHNKRALDPTGPWYRLTLAIAYATEARLFITNLNQSPFNVGTQLVLEDFTLEQVEELNRRYGNLLCDEEEIRRYYRLMGGHPYLVRRGFYEMATHAISLATLETHAPLNNGPFGDHLRHILMSVSHDPVLCEAIRGVIQGRSSLTTESFYRLRSAGLVMGDSLQDARPRCQLYAIYLEKRLLSQR